MVKNGIVYKAGGLARVGVVIANGRVMQKAEKMLVEAEGGGGSQGEEEEGRSRNSGGNGIPCI